MKAIEIVGDIEIKTTRLQAQVPPDLTAGPVRLIVLLPDEDDAGSGWSEGAAREWADELKAARQDIYSLEDGQRVNAPR